MFVNDVITDADVCGDGDVESDSSGKNADVFVRVIAFEDVASDRFAQSNAFLRRCLGNEVEVACFCPQSKFSGADVFAHAFGGCADASKFVVVNGAGAIARNMGDEAAFHQVDEIARGAGANDVGADHEDDCAIVLPGAYYSICDDGKVGVVKGRYWRVEVGNLIDREVVFPLVERAEFEFGAVEGFVGHVRGSKCIGILSSRDARTQNHRRHHRFSTCPRNRDARLLCPMEIREIPLPAQMSHPDLISHLQIAR